VVVTVNFGDAPYKMSDGSELPALDLKITGI